MDFGGEAAIPVAGPLLVSDSELCRFFSWERGGFWCVVYDELPVNLASARPPMPGPHWGAPHWEGGHAFGRPRATPATYSSSGCPALAHSRRRTPGGCEREGVRTSGPLLRMVEGGGYDCVGGDDTKRRNTKPSRNEGSNAGTETQQTGCVDRGLCVWVKTSLPRDQRSPRRGEVPL